MLWLTEAMLDGQRQREDIPATDRTAHKGLLLKKAGRGSLPNHPSCPRDDPIGQGTELNWTTDFYRDHLLKA